MIQLQPSMPIRNQLQQRYGIDVNDTGATEQDISLAVAQAQSARQQAEKERSTAAAARGDEALTVQPWQGRTERTGLRRRARRSSADGQLAPNAHRRPLRGSFARDLPALVSPQM